MNLIDKDALLEALKGEPMFHNVAEAIKNAPVITAPVNDTCEYGKQVGMPEYSCSPKCVYLEHSDGAAKIAEVTAQRDELLAALKEMTALCESANKRCLDQIGIGLIDIIPISSSNALIAEIEAKG